MSKVVFKAGIDHPNILYKPFILSMIMLFIGVLVFFNSTKPYEQQWMENQGIIWLYAFVSTALFEIIIMRMITYRKSIVVKKEQGEYLLEHKILNKIKNTYVFNYNDLSFWWNYHFGGNEISMNDGNVSGNSSVSGRGTANSINLLIKIYSREGEEILLTQTLGPWAGNPPGWPYSVDNPKNYKTAIKTSGLKKLLKIIEGKQHPNEK